MWFTLKYLLKNKWLYVCFSCILFGCLIGGFTTVKYIFPALPPSVQNIIKTPKAKKGGSIVFGGLNQKPQNPCDSLDVFKNMSVKEFRKLKKNGK